MHKGVLTVDRFEIPYTIVGEGARNLVCVNGMQQTTASWRSLVRHFTAQGIYRVVLFDFPNQGRGRCLRGEPSVDVTEEIGVLAAVVDAIAPDTAVALVGGSWGAVVAAAYAARYPARVDRMVLGSFQVRANARLREVARRGRSLVAEGRGDELAALFIREFGTHLPVDWQRSILAQFAALRHEQFQQMYEHAARFVNAEDLGQIADLGAIQAETLIVNGAADPIIDAADPDTLSRIPLADRYIVPGVGHFLHVECPDVLNVYSEFLHVTTPEPVCATDSRSQYAATADV